ncbi:hypothetical protein SAMN05444678_11692 [Sphingomonas sp. YR710]|uniref:hypothetical protein n=1 Tax=Sphingomonas sp. YR710 TaxID=1882773 RepID=UPI00088F9E61|nr:hypothetical protein [Sphingomonas sp. YR710]SDD58763.1 hypothetical protein SAMN05444678_11692 [Sphingomonas sp. YR710]
MPTYLVRLKADQPNPYDIVGLFIADNVTELEELVDECCDAFACEFTTLPNGGIYMSGPAIPIPSIPDESEDLNFFRDATMTDSWAGPFFHGTDVPPWTSLAECPWSSDEERQQLADSAMAKLMAHYDKPGAVK